jgi:hypothetical protein
MPAAEMADVERMIAVLSARIAALEGVIQTNGSTVVIRSSGGLNLDVGGALNITVAALPR